VAGAVFSGGAALGAYSVSGFGEDSVNVITGRFLCLCRRGRRHGLRLAGGNPATLEKKTVVWVRVLSIL
jgi:hypothetical protein